ncbi:transcription-repair coupling factor [Saccharobesus litoralis]|uniref:Transcription-repair-coupling factor n=1 Tax=Saccharobesus litoralis TaxID=2172099 RepID=A0A2S0VUF1_9ALTE|nr:transcription-repair coupling factor [Saccharobesus litoralis]AWB67847.1 transcription-repair coupling factor [Saccharobesus litoralis]
MAQASIFSPAIPSLKKRGDHIRWGNLAGSSLAIALNHAAAQSNNPFVVITPDTPSALRLTDELNAYAKNTGLGVFYFPDWETLPYDTFSPHQDIISQRLATLNNLQMGQAGIYVVSASTALAYQAPQSFFSQYSLILKQGQTVDINAMRDRLSNAGYRAVDQVMEHGEYSLRGSILDLYPMGSDSPFRLDFFDDELDTIRQFDPETQRSSETIKLIELLPAHEFPTDKKAIELFRRQYRELFDANTDKESIYYQVSKNIMPAGIEYYLPLFFEQCQTLFDYLPQDTQIAFANDVKDKLVTFAADVENRYQDRRYDTNRPLLKPELLFLKHDVFFQQLGQFNRIEYTTSEIEEKAGRYNYLTDKVADIAIDGQAKDPYKAFNAFIQEQQHVVILCESEGRRETILELLAKGKLKVKQFKSLNEYLKQPHSLGICVTALEHSFIAEQNNQPIAFICESELLGNRVKQRRRRRGKGEVTTTENIVKNLAELTSGQPVVHVDHGVGRYLGLQTIDAGGMPTEFLTIEYADSKLYVPVASLHLISRYSGADVDNAPLHKLSSDAWQKAKKKAAEKVRDVAAELLDVYAKRATKKGFKFNLDKQSYQQFSAGFPFEETDDQQNAINHVVNDMLSEQAMDRLVCGDVGFGKTEVAMRAAFIAVNESKQVAVLVPTTLLAQQHYENFKDRFANWPVKVEVLSRFKTAKEQKAVLQELADGKVDIVIGTHKLLQADVNYHNLGLLIVDEEHRFGVRQKEIIKKQRANVDILTLTATPIPRTLNMSMSGMRDLSIIATPPAKRLAVKTFVRQHQDALVKEALTREIMRGGQVYFLHNSVETIEKTAADLQKLLPDARIVTAHGQMRERELEQVMSDFYHQRFNVLVCTTIIETGIDVPTANTIVIDRADHFGLAQLHQLRGRVGRSHHQAYAYLLTPHPKAMTKDAVKRLEAIESLEDLGAGFALATHDLEIRGAGELLGDEQSGQIQTVGFTLYMEMLDKAVAALKQGKEPALDDVLKEQTEVELRLPALIPEDYVPDVSLRLSLYKKIASCQELAEVEDTHVELIDRFGLLPQPAKNLLQVAKLKLQADNIGIRKVEAGPKGGLIEFNKDTKVDPEKIIALIQSAPTVFSFAGPEKIRFNLEIEEANERIKFVEQLITDLSGKAA